MSVVTGYKLSATLTLFLITLSNTVCSSEGEKSSFNRDVLPILSDKCFHCHGRDATNQDSEFRLHSQENALADLGGYFGIKPGDLEASELHLRIRSNDYDQMPPEEAVRQLTDEEKDVLDAWILEGAEYEAHWSYTSLPERVDVPDEGIQWAKNAIDRFVFARQQFAGMSPNREMGKEAWLRRVTFDLTGLPPSITEIEDFLRDDSTNAYENRVVELLAKKACAERLTTEWLDVARYSDSYGYQRDERRFVWPWRDWVIEAFHQNIPYDQFMTWQLAGDLLPDATREQKLATTFNRLHSHKKEGGVAIEEFRVEYVADRTHTVGTAFMGLTFECSRCHDHKYDPITMKDYYGLSSFFANIDERGLISHFTDAVPTPSMPLPNQGQEQALKEAELAVATAEAEYARVQEEARDDFQEWLSHRKPSPLLQGIVAHLTFDSFETPQPRNDDDNVDKTQTSDLSNLYGLSNVVTPGNLALTSKANSLVPGRRGQAIQLTGDDAVTIPNTGQYARDQPFSIVCSVKTPETKQRAVIYRHSRGWDDAGSLGYELIKLGGRLNAKLCHFWPGNAICVETEDILNPGQWMHVAITYDGSSKARGLRIYLNGIQASTTIVKDNLTRQITKWRDGEDYLAIGSRYRDRGFKEGLVDDFYVFDRSLSALEVLQLSDGESLEQVLAKPTDALSATELNELFQYYLLVWDQPARQARADLRKARRKWNAAMDATPAITVMRELDQPRPAYLLKRGQYDRRGERITADTPEFLPDFPADQPRNRLGLSQWLTSPNHPLTARVTVNRYWQLMFGKGLVRTPEDFGAQGERPTHPALLDWLARDFVDHGWNVRRLLRMIALSATYRQSAVVPGEVREQDPENRLLARGFDKRLSAEMIRDNVLAVSGLLSNKVGGPPARPYDISLSYKPSEADQGLGLYCRSLYTFWQRTAPAPVMTAFNASNREVCRLRREVAPSPLQALVMLNGTQFVEASRVYAANLLARHDENSSAIISEAFLSLTSQNPKPKQLEILSQLYREQLQIFEEHPDRAEKLLAVGNAINETTASPARHAAVTVLVNSIMNLDECVRLP